MPLKLGVRRKKNLSIFGGKPNLLKSNLGVPDLCEPGDDPEGLAPLLGKGGHKSPPLGSPETPKTPLGSGLKSSLEAPKGSPNSSSRSSPDRSGRESASIDMTPTPTGEEHPLLPLTGSRRRRREAPPYVPSDWDDTLPYGGKVYLARRKKPDSWLCIGVQVLLIAFAVGMVYYGWYHTEHLHFHATKLYGHYGHPIAQAMTAEKYLHGKGVEQNFSLAMEWYRRAALQGHPHSSYNLAVGHLQGMDVGLRPGEAHDLIKHAAKHGVIEAADVLNKVCSKGRCDD